MTYEEWISYEVIPGVRFGDFKWMAQKIDKAKNREKQLDLLDKQDGTSRKSINTLIDLGYVEECPLEVGVKQKTKSDIIKYLNSKNIFMTNLDNKKKQELVDLVLKTNHDDAYGYFLPPFRLSQLGEKLIQSHPELTFHWDYKVTSSIYPSDLMFNFREEDKTVEAVYEELVRERIRKEIQNAIQTEKDKAIKRELEEQEDRAFENRVSGMTDEEVKREVLLDLLDQLDNSTDDEFTINTGSLYDIKSYVEDYSRLLEKQGRWDEAAFERQLLLTLWGLEYLDQFGNTYWGENYEYDEPITSNKEELLQTGSLTTLQGKVVEHLLDDIEQSDGYRVLDNFAKVWEIAKLFAGHSTVNFSTNERRKFIEEEIRAF
ncbi:MAG: hypothetical protein LBM27_04170 [Lactobacillaceae bacterium]|jgi:hypothetical protein|nr:hypothetical protein [Lactobacillaceae bacterium]